MSLAISSEISSEEMLVDEVLFKFVKSISIPILPKYPKDKFELLRAQVKKSFVVPGTSITPVMERLLYALSSIKKPKKMLMLGIYCGNTLVWNVGTSCGDGKHYKSNCCIAVDINPEAINMAQSNFNNIKEKDHISFFVEDAMDTCLKTDGYIDYLYLDAEDKIDGKSIYLRLLKAVYNKLCPGAWVLAHDTIYQGAGFPDQFKGYLEYVRNPEYFFESVSFQIDKYGLELSIKN